MNDTAASDLNEGSLLGEVMKFLADDGWLATAAEGQSVLRTGFEGENGNWMCYAQTDEEDRQFAFYSLCPVKVAAGKRATMAEFLTRANYRLVLGNLDMDFQGGEIRCKTSIGVEDSPLTAGMIRPFGIY